MKYYIAGGTKPRFIREGWVLTVERVSGPLERLFLGRSTLADYYIPEDEDEKVHEMALGLEPCGWRESRIIRSLLEEALEREQAA